MNCLILSKIVKEFRRTNVNVRWLVRRSSFPDSGPTLECLFKRRTIVIVLLLLVHPRNFRDKTILRDVLVVRIASSWFLSPGVCRRGVEAEGVINKVGCFTHPTIFFCPRELYDF